MLNQNRVLQYVKTELGFPFVQLEMEDEDILEYVTEFTLREFSYYLPDVYQVYLNLTLAQNKVAGRQNEYYITDPDNREILNVIDIHFPDSDLFIHGHPAFGPFTMGEVADWGLAVNNAMTVKMFSSFDKTFEFKHPNIVRISPVPNDVAGCAVEYERIHSSDLSTIPNDFQRLFMDLSAADIMIRLGRIRKKYGGGNLRTPFGEIPLESDVYEEGKDKKRELIEKMERLSLPNISIDYG